MPSFPSIGFFLLYCFINFFFSYFFLKKGGKYEKWRFCHSPQKVPLVFVLETPSFCSKMRFFSFLFCFYYYSLFYLLIIFPFLFLFQLHDFMEDQAKILLKEHGISFCNRGVFFIFFFESFLMTSLFLLSHFLSLFPLPFFYKADITNYLSVWENHVKFEQFLSNGGAERGEGVNGALERLEKWLKNFPFFILKYYYCKRSFLREVCYCCFCCCHCCCPCAHFFFFQIKNMTIHIHLIFEVDR